MLSDSGSEAGSEAGSETGSDSEKTNRNNLLTDKFR